MPPPRAAATPARPAAASISVRPAAASIPVRPAGPPTPAFVSGVVDRLAEISALFAAGEITGAERAAMRARVLEIPLGSEKPATAIAVDNESTKSRRELLTLAAKWCGSLELPALGGHLWDTLVLGTPDAVLARQLKELSTGTALQRQYMQLFQAAGSGVCPECLRVEGAGTALARAGVYEWLLRLASCQAVAHLERLAGTDSAASARQATADTFFLILSDDENAHAASTLLASYRLRKNSEESLRKLDQAPAAAQQSPGRKSAAPAKKPLAGAKKAASPAAKKCFRCGGQGHMAALCPSK